MSEVYPPRKTLRPYRGLLSNGVAVDKIFLIVWILVDLRVGIVRSTVVRSEHGGELVRVVPLGSLHLEVNCIGAFIHCILRIEAQRTCLTVWTTENCGIKLNRRSTIHITLYKHFSTSKSDEVVVEVDFLSRAFNGDVLFRISYISISVKVQLKYTRLLIISGIRKRIHSS